MELEKNTFFRETWTFGRGIQPKEGEGSALLPSDMGMRVALLYRYSQSYLNEELKKYGLGNGQYVFLLHLLEHEGINQEKLAHMVKIDKTTAARAVAKLVEAGYVRRRISEKDRRAYVLRTTEKAQTVKKALKKTMDDWYKILVQDFSPEECRQFDRLLKQAVENAAAQEV